MLILVDIFNLKSISGEFMLSEIRKKTGRPDLNLRVTTTIRISFEMYDKLCEISNGSKKSINQLMIDAIEEKYCEYETEMKKRMKMNMLLDNLP